MLHIFSNKCLLIILFDAAHLLMFFSPNVSSGLCMVYVVIKLIVKNDHLQRIG